jgi:predicted AlkP superfamily pyrophosphatase or phosphodiesterase
MSSLKQFAPTLALAAAAALTAPSLEAKGTAEHVVVVVFDGMRPDFIRPQYCPNLYSLATNGVFFRRHHPVFVSTTIVNGTALATGTHPGHSGIIANNDYRQELNFTSPVASEVLDTIRRGDLLSGNKYVAVDTLAEIIQDAGHHTYVAGTKSVTLLHDRGVRKTDTDAHKNSVVLGRGLSMPRAMGDSLKKANEDKSFPDGFATPNYASDNWTTRALVRGLWKKGVPKYSLLWLTDPDVTQHAKSVGSKEALDGIEASDKNLGEVLKELDEKKLRDKTDIFVVSDHGFSAIDREADIVTALKNAKLNASSKNDNPEKGDVIVVNLGAAALIYVIDRDEAVVRKAAATLQQCNFTGVLFSRLPIDGTFPMENVRYDGVGKGSPDLVVSMRWFEGPNEFGHPGMVVSTGGGRGGGTHGSLSRYDMNNILVASGPDLKRGIISETPSGNIDLAPTILDLLGIAVPKTMDGRVLREAYASFTGPAPQVKEQRKEASRTLGFMEWSQYLKTSEVDGALYFDEGNGTSAFR